VWLGDALRDSGKMDSAREAFARAIALSPHSFWGEEARRLRARLASRAGEPV